MVEDLKIQRNLAFLMAALIGSSYLFMLFVGASKIYSGFVMQLIFLGEYFRNPQSGIGRLTSNPGFLTNVTAGLILLGLLLILVKGLLKSFYFLLKTKQYLNSLKIVKKTKEAVVFKSNRPHAFTAGFLKPTVYISSRIAKKKKEKKSKAIIFHELGHKENFDPIKDFLVNIFKWCLPPLPGKNKFFTEYSTLVELNCDFYAEKRLSSKRPIVEALADIIGRKFSPAPNPLLIDNFLTSSDRIRILTENRPFKAKRLFSLALILFSPILLNVIFISQTSLFLKCDCLTDCLRDFFDQKTQITSQNHQGCRSPATELVNSCRKIKN